MEMSRVLSLNRHLLDRDHVDIDMPVQQVPLHRRPTNPNRSGVDDSNFEGEAWRMSRRML